MIYNKIDSEINKMLKIIRESQLKEEEISDDSQQQQEGEIESPEYGISNNLIPINEHTFPGGILSQEEEKISEKIPSVSFGDNPFLYNPSNKTVTLTGEIKNLSGLRFYFTTDVSTSDGCFIFVNSMLLNSDALNTLSILKGHYDIFAASWGAFEISKKLQIRKEDIKRYQEEYSGVNFFKP